MAQKIQQSDNSNANETLSQWIIWQHSLPNGKVGVIAWRDTDTFLVDVKNVRLGSVAAHDSSEALARWNAQENSTKYLFLEAHKKSGEKSDDASFAVINFKPGFFRNLKAAANEACDNLEKSHALNGARILSDTGKASVRLGDLTQEARGFWWVEVKTQDDGNIEQTFWFESLRDDCRTASLDMDYMECVNQSDQRVSVVSKSEDGTYDHDFVNAMCSASEKFRPCDAIQDVVGALSDAIVHACENNQWIAERNLNIEIGECLR